MTQLTNLKVILTWRPERGMERIVEATQGLVLLVPEDREATLRHLVDADVAFAAGFDSEMLNAAPKLRWIHAVGGGVESLLFPELVSSSVILTCSSPCFDVPGAEYALATMLAFSRRLDYDMRQRPKRAYTWRDPFDLKGKTVGIIGLGHIGAEVAKRARAFGMRVVGITRTPRPLPDYVDELLAVDQLPQLMSASDFVVVAVPNSRQTRGIVGERMLRSMKQTAYLIDVSGRPALYDMEELTRALQERWIAGAALQIVPEDDSPLWDLDNLIISYHRACSVEQYDACIALFCENLLRFRTDQPLLGMVDKVVGY